MPQNEIFRGVVVSGRGLAGSTLTRSAIMSEMAEMTGLRMVPGKLNVVLGEDCTEKLSEYVPFKELGGLPGVQNRKGVRS